MKIERETFGELPDGTAVEMLTIQNGAMRVAVVTYGGIITNIYAPDRNGALADVVLGYSSLQDYVKGKSYFGAIIGRYANRIAGGQFALDGKYYGLACNDGQNHLHGGWNGFDKAAWHVQRADDHSGLELTYFSREGEEGYPGNLHVGVDYSLSDDNELRIDYRAVTDADTIVNLTNHSYFNLRGTGTVLEHELMIEADEFTPIRNGLIPTGEIRNIAGTPMDFTGPMTMGARISEPDEQLLIAGGYDHNFVLRNLSGELKRAAQVHEPLSGRKLEVLTTQPGLQFYSGNFLNGSEIGKHGEKYEKHFGFCLETQHFPDSPNHPEFPSTTLRAGVEYHQTTVFRFSVD